VCARTYEYDRSGSHSARSIGTALCILGVVVVLDSIVVVPCWRPWDRARRRLHKHLSIAKAGAHGSTVPRFHGLRRLTEIRHVLIGLFASSQRTSGSIIRKDCTLRTTTARPLSLCKYFAKSDSDKSLLYTIIALLRIVSRSCRRNSP
jgi:hypothetical protein